jgi:hypothetical protein
MGRAGLAVAMLAATLGGVSTNAAAAPCGATAGFPGFQDVQDTDIFCNAAQWLRNRAITVGCTSTTTYCPADAVTRGAMALFLNRLGQAVTPVFVSRQSATGTGIPINPGDFIPFCETQVTDIPAVNYPRQLRARGTITAPLSGSAIGLNLYRRFNGGPYTSMVTVEALVQNPSGDQVIHWSSGIIPLPPANSATVAVGLINRGTTNPLVLGNNGRCAIEVEAFNANPASAPFDEPN